MKNIFNIHYLFALALIWGAAGCARIEHHATFPESKPIALGSNLGPDRPYALVRPFDDFDRQYYLFLHLLPLNAANGFAAAEDHLHEGDGVVNLRIHTFYGAVDLLLSVVTVGIVTSYTIETHGDIVRLSEKPPKL